MQMPIAQPSFGDGENDAVLASGTIAQSQVTAAFEEEFTDFSGVSYTAAANNGSAALHAARVEPGDKVVIPGVTDEARTRVCETINGVI